MFDIREYLREGYFGKAHLGMPIEKFRLSMPEPDYEQVDGANLFLFYGDIELCFPKYKDNQGNRLFYIQPKFMQLNGDCGQSDSFPFNMNILKRGISINIFKVFCFENEIPLEQLTSNDDDFDLFLIGKNVLGFFISEISEISEPQRDDVNFGLQKLITDSSLYVKNK